MSVFEALVLGLVQGLTEFLPISSTAHLAIVPQLLGWEDPGAAFSAVIQLGTVGSVLVYFARDIRQLFLAFVSSLKNRNPAETQASKLAWAVLVGTLPISILGLLFKSLIKTKLRSMWVIATALIVMALVLFAVEKFSKRQRSLDSLDIKDGLWVGLWQALALVPGASRSGSTLTGALALGLNRESAARFSFLLSIPATTLAGLFQLKELFKESGGMPWLPVMVGTAVSFVVGLGAIGALLTFLKTRSTLPFVVYRIAMGLFLLGTLTGFIHLGTAAAVG
jgi:undecaprenyl-diphosphatase